MWRWIMRVFFGKAPTCQKCGFQMPQGGYQRLYWNGAWTDVSPQEECRQCGSADIRYKPLAQEGQR